MATAGYTAKIAVTTTSTNPTSADVLENVTTSGANRARDELDTSVLGTVEKSHLLGQRQTEVPLEVLTDSASIPEGRLVTAEDAGTTIYVHVMPDGSTGFRYPVKVSGYSETINPGEPISRSYTIKSVGARVATTLS